MSAEAEIQVVNDREGGVFSTLTTRRLKTIPFEIESVSEVTILGDAEGGVALYSDEHLTMVGPLEMRRTDQLGMFVTDKEESPQCARRRRLWGTSELSPFDGGLLFSPLLVTSALNSSKLYVSGASATTSAIKKRSSGDHRQYHDRGVSDRGGAEHQCRPAGYRGCLQYATAL